MVSEVLRLHEELRFCVAKEHRKCSVQIRFFVIFSPFSVNSFLVDSLKFEDFQVQEKPGLIPVKDWEGDEAPAVGMAVKCRVVHAAGLQGTSSVCMCFICVLCMSCVCMSCVCISYVLCARVLCVSLLGSFLGPALAQGANMRTDVQL